MTVKGEPDSLILNSYSPHIKLDLSARPSYDGPCPKYAFQMEMSYGLSRYLPESVRRDGALD